MEPLHAMGPLGGEGLWERRHLLTACGKLKPLRCARRVRKFVPENLLITEGKVPILKGITLATYDLVMETL